MRTILASISKGRQDELQRDRPHPTLEDEVFLNVMRTADHLLWADIEVLRTADLTFPQYNVLRVMRGARPQRLSCREISDRMVTRDSDITRLLDRLEARGLVERTRDAKDRRLIVPQITRRGLALLRRLDGPVQQAHRSRLGHMSPAQLESLSRLLELARHGDRIKCLELPQQTRPL